MRFQPNYYIACRIQDKILNMMGVKPQCKRNYDPKAVIADLTPAQLTSLTNAFDTMEERKRVLRMKPKPKAQEVKEVSRGPVHVAPRE